MSREDEIKARLEKATKGPWYWNVNPSSKRVELVNSKSDIVMDFVRWGMNGVTPRFNINGLMVKATEMLANWPGRDHHERWAKRIVNPDADLIANAPADIDYLLAENARLRAENEELRKQNNDFWDTNQGV